MRRYRQNSGGTSPGTARNKVPSRTYNSHVFFACNSTSIHKSRLGMRKLCRQANFNRVLAEPLAWSLTNRSPAGAGPAGANDLPKWSVTVVRVKIKNKTSTVGTLTNLCLGLPMLLLHSKLSCMLLYLRMCSLICAQMRALGPCTVFTCCCNLERSGKSMVLPGYRALGPGGPISKDNCGAVRCCRASVV